MWCLDCVCERLIKSVGYWQVTFNDENMKQLLRGGWSVRVVYSGMSKNWSANSYHRLLFAVDHNSSLNLWNVVTSESCWSPAPVRGKKIRNCFWFFFRSSPDSCKHRLRDAPVSLKNRPSGAKVFQRGIWHDERIHAASFQSSLAMSAETHMLCAIQIQQTTANKDIKGRISVWTRIIQSASFIPSLVAL